MIVRICRIDGNQRYSWIKKPAIMVREPDATRQPTPHDNQLMSKHRVLGFKPQLRLEWRAQDGQNETEQPDHSASIGDSITASTQIRFLVHTGASIFKMVDQSGHKSIDTLRGYVRDAELFKDHAGTGLL
jgi:hypothetical protein